MDNIGKWHDIKDIFRIFCKYTKNISILDLLRGKSLETKPFENELKEWFEMMFARFASKEMS